MKTHSISWKSISRVALCLFVFLGLLVSGSAQAQGTPSITWDGVLTGFPNQIVGTSSNGQMVVVSGTQLTSPIVVTAPANYQVALSNTSGSYTSSVSISPVGGTVSATNLFIRYSPGVVGTHAAQVTLASTGAATQQIPVNGNSISVRPTVSSVITFGTSTTSTIDVLFSGGNGQKRLLVAHREADPMEMPEDGNYYAADATFGQGASLGNGNYVVYNGTGNAVTVTVGSVGLYKFEVYEYNDNNVPSAASYLVPGGQGEQATAAESFTWIGGQVDPNTNMPDNNWANRNNWTPVRAVPNNNDILIFDGASMMSNVVNLDFASPHYIGQLQLINNANCSFVVATDRDLNIGMGLPGADLLIELGSSVEVVSSNTSSIGLNLIVNSLNRASIAGSIHFKALGTATHRHRLMAYDTESIEFLKGAVFTSGTRSEGNVFGNSTWNAGTVIFRSGSVYQHLGGVHPFGLAAPQSVVAFQSGSLYRHEVVGGIHMGGRTYGNLLINHPNYNSTVTASGSGAFTVDTLTVNAATMIHVQINSPVIIKGDLRVNAGNFIISPSSTIQNTTFSGIVMQTIATSGTGTITFGDRSNVQIPSNRSVVVNNNVTVGYGLTLGGTLDVRGAVIGGAGFFTMQSGASILTRHAQGLAATGNMGSIQVAGTRTFASGYYTYNGTAAQVSGTGIPSATLGLTVDNAAGLTLSKAVRVNTQLALTNGIVTTTAGNLLTVGDLATLTGAGTTSFINGPLARIATTASALEVTFPIGKGTSYRPVALTLSHSGSTATTYTAELYTSAPALRTLPASMNAVSETRYYNITKGAGATVTAASLRMIFTNDEGFVDPASTRIAGASGSEWIDLGGNFNSGNSTIQSTANFTTFGDFAMGGTVQTLPVELISLQAKARNKTVLVEWVTASEENNDYFEVQRSADGINFKKIGHVEGNNTTAFRTNYNFTDVTPLNGLAYYRLRQVDTDGKATLLGPVTARIESAGVAQMALYPNPASHVANLTFEVEEMQEAQVRILNMIGATVSTTNISTVSGLNQVVLPVDQLKAGVYVVEVTTSTGSVASRLIKQ